MWNAGGPEAGTRFDPSSRDPSYTEYATRTDRRYGLEGENALLDAAAATEKYGALLFVEYFKRPLASFPATSRLKVLVPRSTWLCAWRTQLQALSCEAN